MTYPTEVQEQNARLWAQALSDERLAADLRRLARNVRFQTGAMRAALLEEAALRVVHSTEYLRQLRQGQERSHR